MEYHEDGSDDFMHDIWNCIGMSYESADIEMVNYGNRIGDSDEKSE